MKIRALGTAGNIDITLLTKGTGVLKVASGYEANVSSAQDITNVGYILNISKTFTAKQIFNPSSTAAAINIGAVSGAPSLLSDGDIWYDSSLNKFRARQNGSTIDLIGSGGGGSGTVTSVGLTMPSIFTVTGTNPITNSGTFGVSLNTQNANTFLAGPTTGAASTPTFRTLVTSDIPALPYLSDSLPSTNIFVGNLSNVATAVALSGDISISSLGVVTIGNSAVTFSKFQNISTNKILGRYSVSTGTVEEISIASPFSVSGGSLSLSNNSITNGLIRQSAGLSVLGRSSSSTGDISDIVASSDNTILSRSGSSIAFNTLTAAMIPDNIVSDSKIRQSAGLSILGRSSNTSGNVADITASTDGDVLRRNGTTIGFGTISGLSLSGFTAGQIVFGSSTTGLTSSSSFFWDSTASGLVIGSNSITSLTRLDVRGISSGSIFRAATFANVSVLRIQDNGRIAFGSSSVNNYIIPANAGVESISGNGLRFVASNNGFYFSSSGANLHNGASIINMVGNYTVLQDNSVAGGAALDLLCGIINTAANNFIGNNFTAFRVRPTVNCSAGSTVVSLADLDIVATSISNATLYGLRVINTNLKNGFGTSTPTVMLEVAGDFKSVGNINLDVTSKKLNILGLPTSSSGLSTGDIWNNSGVLTIV